MNPNARVCVERRGDEALVQACGSLALLGDVTPSLLSPPNGVRRIEWDLSLVTDVDAHGLGVLADAARTGRDLGVPVSVRAASAVVHRLAALVRLDAAIPGTWQNRDRTATDCAASAR
jgi:ABC-type transporter Mla MlaB component